MDKKNCIQVDVLQKELKKKQKEALRGELGLVTDFRPHPIQHC